MPESDKITLAEANKQGKLDQFIAEREKHLPGDRETFDDTLNSMVGKWKRVPGTSKRGARGG